MTLKPARLQWSEDGSVLSLDYHDVYFQRGQGAAEADYVFLSQNNLPERFSALHHEPFIVAETGFGTGLNFLRTCRLFAQAAPQTAKLIYISFEKHPIVKDALEKILSLWPETVDLAQDLLRQYPPMLAGHHRAFFLDGRITLQLIYGDMNETLPRSRFKSDAWFLDCFSPRDNPDAWHDPLLHEIAARTKAGGTLSSFTAVGHVRKTLADAGFTVQKTKGFGIKRHMTTAQMPGSSPAPFQKPSSATVIGAGIAGASAARALAESGVSVDVFEREARIAHKTSGNHLGIIYPKMTVDESPLDSWHQHSFCYALRLLAHLKPSSWNPCGVWHQAIDTEDRQRFENLITRREPPTDYARIENSGLLQEPAGMIDPRDFCAGLLDHPNIRVTCDHESNIPAYSDTPIILALGADILAQQNISFAKLQAVRGQVTHIAATPESQKLKHAICHDGYITPAQDDLHVIGATFQKDRMDTQPDPGDDLENVQKLNTHLPQLGFTAADIGSSRAGIRVSTPDKLPIVGAVPDVEKTIAAWRMLRDGKDPTEPAIYAPNIYVLSGLGAHGLTDAPLAGAILAAMITGAPLPVPTDLLQHLLPERFLWRGLKRKQL